MVIVVSTIKPVLKITDRVMAAICMRSLLGPAASRMEKKKRKKTMIALANTRERRA